MGRPSRQVPSAMLNVRVDQSVKQRLAAAAFHDLSRTGGVTSPDGVNLSEFLRDRLLMPWLMRFEEANGGTQALASNYTEAQIQALQASMTALTALRDDLPAGEQSTHEAPSTR